MNTIISVPKARWTAIGLKISRAQTSVDCAFQVRNGSVNVLLMTPRDAGRFNSGLSHHPLASTGFDSSGRLRHEIEVPGDYILLLDNRLDGRHSVEVDLRVDLWNREFVTPVTLSPARRAVVVAASGLFFLLVAGFSARQFFRPR